MQLVISKLTVWNDKYAVEFIQLNNQKEIKIKTQKEIKF